MTEPVRALVFALERIRDHEVRADRRKRGMVDVSEIEDLQRIARYAVTEFELGECRKGGKR
jgi:hypothetical protein